MSTMMGDWLGRNLFDEIPEGIPPLDSEDDDESDEGSEFAADTQQYAPPGFDTETSVVVTALPTEGQNLPGSDEKHCTLVYLGHIGGDGADALGDSRDLLMRVANLAAKERQPFSAEVTSVEPLGVDGAMVMMLGSPEMVAIRNDVIADPDVAGLDEQGTYDKHPEFLPHVTVGYDVPDAEIEAAREVTEIEFDRLALWWGKERIEFPFVSGDYAAAPARHKKGSEGGGRFKRPDMGDTADSDEDGDGFQSEAERRRHLVKAILAAMDDILDDLTSAQARALIAKVKSNARAFLDAQVAGSPGGPDKKGPAKKGGPDKGGPDKKDGPDKGGKSKSGGGKDGGDSDGPDKKGSGGPLKAMVAAVEGLLKGMIAAVEGLLRGFARNMKEKDRKALTKALDDLKRMD